MSEASPRDLLDLPSPGQTKKALILVGDPEIPRSVLGDAVHHAARNSSDRNEAAVLQVAQFPIGGDPNSPTTILKKRIRRIPIELPVSSAENGDLRAVPAVQATISGAPDAPIPVR